jgi:prepilin-type N-terminal cleavage/methylation domain-containing protein
MKQVRKFKNAAAQLGFTLIELSIVLVIIGLIVGGILVGQDLIKAAEIRATVSQLEKYATAVNTFRSKYNGLPGDLLNASNFGFDAARGSMSDGDAVIESTNNSAASFAGETSCFWDDLTTAALIGDSLNGSGACGTTATTALVNNVPAAKLGRGNYIIVGSNAGINYWGLTGLGAMSPVNNYATATYLTGSEAFQIDSKIDDGGPTAGSVQAMANAPGGIADGAGIWVTADAATAAAAGVCVAAGGVYNFATNGGNDQGCQLRLRSNF